MDNHLIEQKAHDISQWLQDAVGDIAYDHFPMDPEWQRRVKKAKENGVTDIKGWLADEYYNDVDTLSDLCGDRIYDAASELKRDSKEDLSHDTFFIAIAEKMKETAHGALIKALDKLIGRRS